ncbi:MAG: MMPL family transporter [Bacteroidales bacterium]|nr:MMPL family transporter [Bacteroidales bacterium]
MKILIQKYRFLIVIGVVILTSLSISQFTKLSINSSFNDYIPKDVGNRAHLNNINKIFGGSEKIMLILSNSQGIINNESFDGIQNLTKELQELEGIEQCLSLLDVIDIKLEDGITYLDPLLSDIPTNRNELENLKSSILNNSMGQRFVSSDLTSTAIVLTKSNDIEDNRIIPAIKDLVDNYSGQEKIHIGGLSYIRHSIKSYIKVDLITLLPAALVLMVLMLYFSFREWKGVLLPFSVVILSIIFSFGLMAVLGWEISLMSVLLPIMLIAIANDYGIHLINLYQEKVILYKNSSMKNVAVNIYRELRKPILITALTTIGGMLGLLSHKMPPAAELGVLASFGISSALLMSLLLIPILLSFWNKPKKKAPVNKARKPIVDRVLTLFSKWVTIYPKRVVLSFILVALISIVGLFFLKVDTNIESYFIGKSDIRKGIDLVNEKFGGSQYVSILFKGDVLSPESLQRIDNYTKEIEELPEAGHVISPSIFLKELSKAMYMPNEKGYLKLPKTQDEAFQYLEIFSMSGYDDQVSQLIDYNYENARILVSLKDGSNQTGKSLLKSLNKITEGDPLLVCIAGPGLSKIQIADMVIQGQITSLILAFVIIFIILSIIFKSIVAGLNGILPLVLSTLILFGVMGFLGISLDIVTTLLSSIMIGVGVDYTIHFLWRYKADYAKLRDNKQAIISTLNTAGRGIVFNAFSVIVGFSVLIFSNFAPLRFFGVLVAVSIFSCLISGLLLIPAIITITKPRFLEPHLKPIYEKIYTYN